MLLKSQTNAINNGKMPPALKYLYLQNPMLIGYIMLPKTSGPQHNILLSVFEDK
jgi:hypothetical protein